MAENNANEAEEKIREAAEKAKKTAENASKTFLGFPPAAQYIILGLAAIVCAFLKLPITALACAGLGIGLFFKNNKKSS